MPGKDLPVSSLLDRIRPSRLLSTIKEDYIYPRALSNDELALRQLPPKPVDLELEKAWLATFGKELRSIAFDPSLSTTPILSSFQPTSVVTRQAVETRAAKQFDSSPNWSGVYILPKPGKRFVQIWGKWTVPYPGPPSSGELKDIDYQCSTWIGFDGQRRYLSSTLPQIGTLQTVKAGVRSTTAWVQWWQRDDPANLPVTLWNFPVDPGDTVSCVLTVQTERNPDYKEHVQSVLFNIVNQTQNNVMGLTVDPPAVEKGSTSRLWIPGATAEWIMERPGVLEDNTLRTLPDYGTWECYDCVAVEAPDHDTSVEAQVRRDLADPWFIRMYQVLSGPPSRSVPVSTPALINESSFNVTYERDALPYTMASPRPGDVSSPDWSSGAMAS
jgi:hypothetical protein